MNPYAVLGIRRNATPKTIQRAFRKRSLETHPDRGGSAEAFQEVKRAYEILSNPDRRERYDATGDTSELPPDNTGAQAIRLLGERFLSIVQAALARSAVVSQLDLMAEMNRSLNTHLLALTESRHQGRAALKPLQAIRERLSVESGENELATILDRQIVGIEQNLAGVEKQIAIALRAMEELRRYRYRVDKNPWPPTYSQTRNFFVLPTSTSGSTY